MHSYFIPSPTEQRSIIQLCHGFIGGGASCSFAVNLILRNVDRIGRVIKFPNKLNIRGVGLQLAQNPSSFVPGHPKDLRLAGSTSRNNWRKAKKLIVTNGHQKRDTKVRSARELVRRRSHMIDDCEFILMRRGRRD